MLYDLCEQDEHWVQDSSSQSPIQFRLSSALGLLRHRDGDMAPPPTWSVPPERARRQGRGVLGRRGCLPLLAHPLIPAMPAPRDSRRRPGRSCTSASRLGSSTREIVGCHSTAYRQELAPGSDRQGARGPASAPRLPTVWLAATCQQQPARLLATGNARRRELDSTSHLCRLGDMAVGAGGDRSRSRGRR